ncbi:MAG: PorP/SprF family type IX secretion system membrane protein [Paludibacteraceae bacterium]|nr:PorP/SprF family type IX secretion system membrane protein [Paludibacteraceae bacterium]MBP3575477.1 PorP/SprF family type IX secretion system membrane protein [Paludibacteraceae bacterium]
MKRYIVLLCGVLCCVAGVRAQFDPQVGQYMFMQSTYNPAAVGEGDLMRVYGSHRMQFTGIMDAPMTTYFSFSSPFVVGKTQHAAGVRFMNDRFGLFSNQSLHAGYAYRFKLGKGYLSVGADLGFINLSFAVDSVNLKDVAELVQEHAYHNATDNAIPESSGQNGVSGMGFDLGVGVYYATSTWWAGVSYGHVTQPVLEWSDQTEVSVRGTFYAAGGYNWRLRDKKWVLMPSAMLQTDFVGWDVNLTMLAQVNNRYRFGLGYRIAGSVNILLGMDIIDGLQLGYTYELPANGLIRESYGSHELYLAYGFNILKPKRTNRYKSVRYL